ncbi:hypothetical protein PIB30_068861 [Stylosanthes scabra]|uniref:Uncharacterized protein n=1 Tax=Stylosanthes scabra TaxID=79078 RepID=A0ABU6UPP4_9FABA|nr:hypothetical protein [Stylosanthes scabra]
MLAHIGFNLDQLGFFRRSCRRALKRRASLRCYPFTTLLRTLSRLPAFATTTAAVPVANLSFSFAYSISLLQIQWNFLFFVVTCDGNFGTTRFGSFERTPNSNVQHEVEDQVEVEFLALSCFAHLTA